MTQQNNVYMFYPFLIKRQKAIAWFFFLIFYADLVASAQASKMHYVMEVNHAVGTSSNYRPISSKREADGDMPKPIATLPLHNKVDKEVAVRAAELVATKSKGESIGGPGQPEMATFKSIGADNMVNAFTGDFSYNIPLLDVGGYPVNLFYNAGITMDQEASWVGLGWNLNPGVVNRNMRGMPDDFNGEDKVTKEMSVKPNLTVGVTAGTGREIAGSPSTTTTLNLNAGLTWNSRKGLGMSMGTNSSFSMQKTLSINNTDCKTNKVKANVGLNGSLNINSMDGVTITRGLSAIIDDDAYKAKFGLRTDIGYNSMQGLTDLKVSAELSTYKDESKAIGTFSSTGNLSFSRSSFMPTMRMTMTSYNALLGVKFGKEEKVLFKNTDLQGFISDQFIQPSDKRIEKPAVGLMYMDKAMAMANAQMDFNRLNDGTYTEKTPVISIPIYTYDVFNISGEGTGGSFRGYRGSVGYVKDYNTVSKSVKGSVNFDIGTKDKAHFGLTLGGAYSQTSVGEWKYNNALKENTRFTPSQADYEGFYFKNPGEKAIIDENYYNAVGQDKLIRPILSSDNGLTNNIFSPSPMLAARYQVFNEALQADGQIPVNSQLKRYTRDKRSQVISYLTAKEAAMVGLDKTIWAYRENTFLPGSCSNPDYKTAFTRYGGSNGPSNPRKAHHLSEITVLEGNASRYVYGLPVYTRLQKEVSFSTEGTVTNNTVKYKTGENTTMNEAGEEGFFQSQQLQDFAHSFLLTSILSPDYMDVKGDGITDDDLGTAVKFNYSCANLTSQSGTTGFEAYKWRFPFGKINNEESNLATFSEGLKTDKTDDKAHYTYGTKELWYLHSIESKNLVATFRVSKRNDGLQVSSENGGPVNNVVCQRELDRIDLYTKADYAKKLTGGTPVPIKSVFFEYGYELCKGFGLNNNPNEGKLTLKKIWFTYNGSNKKKNLYVFGYGSQKNGIELNPNYNTNETDRWGNYKMAASNPASGMSNSDYPYAVQDKSKADAYAAAWCLEKVLLPSGAVLKVDYEADTYSYVQDRRATVVTPIVGFGFNKAATPTNKLYTIPASLGLAIGSLANCALWDHRYVFFEAQQPLQTDAEVKEKYFEGVNQLLLRIWVQVPTDDYGGGDEPVFVYASIKKCGVVTPGGTRFYAELAPTGAGGSPIMETVVDFVRRQLTSKVYPSYKNKNGNALQKVVKATWGMVDQVKKAVKGFEFDFKTKGRCQIANLTKSTARLTVPNFGKYGGGHRVKSIRIADSWDELSKKDNTKVEQTSFYGQEYDYGTVATLGTQTIAISSGVATYEPGVGNDENPFREAYKYYETQPLGPTRPETVELPLAETLYPTPMVGYGKVTVRSIHNNSNKKIKSGVGKQVSEFYTAKDFPVLSDFTPFDNQSQRRFKTDPISEIFQFKQKDLLSLTQGVRVVLNDMNGKPKASYSYPEGDDKTVINSTQYIYRTTKVGENKYKLNNVVPVIMDATGVVGNKMIGKDVEVMNDSREHYSYTYSGQLPINGEFFMAGNIPILIPSIFRMQFRDESQYRSVTTLKVVNEYGILEKVINNDKGSIVSTENMVYDAETGGVLVSKTNNEFKKPVYNTSYPAHWAETGMEPAYKNIGVTYDNIIFRNGRLENPNVDMNLFESGDELLVIDKAKFGVLAWPCTDGTPCERLPQSFENHIWALDMRKDPTNTAKEFIFIDRNGTPYNGGDVWFKIIRSGKRNLVGAALGSAVSQNNPIVTLNGVDKLSIANNSNVINAGAALYKEKWKGQDMFYASTSYTQVLRKAPVHIYAAKPTDATTLAKYRFEDGGWTTEYYPRYNEDYFHARLRDYGNNKPEITTKSWLQFNLSPITSAHQILSAQLSLYSHDEIANGYSHSMLDPYWPGGMTEHYHYNPHYGYNIFYLKRLMTSWKGTSKAGWVNVFENNLADNNQLVVGGPTQYPYSTQSFCNNCGTGSIDNRFEMKSLVEKMIADRDNPQKQYATALQIEMQYRSWDYLTEKRVCFNSGVTNPNSTRAPLLSIKYYNCAEAYGLPGNPVSPPAVQETADCLNYEWVTTCNSVLTKDFINPYVQGFLGNWRPWRSYVFYGQQREKDPLSATNISKDGVIDGFEPYWTLPTTTTGKMQPANSPKWVWNSEVMQYNRKGAQLEDHDPLERYNAAVYGYQETLPIATANNSRVRQVAFDGFEDYGYQDDPCEPYCKPSKRHFETGISATANVLSKEEAHTGQYSYKLDGNTASKAFDLPVGFENTVQDPQLRIAIGSTTTTKPVLNSNGTGLTARYYADYCFAGLIQQSTSISPNVNFSYDVNAGTNTGSAPFYFEYGQPKTMVGAEFNGTLQVPATGEYSFAMSTINEAYVTIAPQGASQTILQLKKKKKYRVFLPPFLNTNISCDAFPDGEVLTGTVMLQAGMIYNINVKYNNYTDYTGNLQLYWKQPCDDIFELLPTRFLYPEGVTPPQLGNQPVVCYQPSEIKANHALIDGFNLIPDKRMVAGVWVKKGGQDCKCNAYTGLSLDIKDGTQTIGSLQATSKMIEGWQLFEGEFTVPASATALQLVVDKVTMGDVFYLDDLRIHPFNANMKSFVYDPQTLWLTSELDENNYASFYEYDDEGTLVRVKKETKDGVKTIKESRSAVQSKITGL
jgi:hypothetical protein